MNDRELIAKRALILVRIEYIKLTDGKLFSMSNLKEYVGSMVRDYVGEETPKTDILGALYFGATWINREVITEEYLTNTPIMEVYSYLTRYFTIEELDLIELAYYVGRPPTKAARKFKGSKPISNNSDRELTEHELDRAFAIRFGRRYSTYESRAMAILDEISPGGYF